MTSSSKAIVNFLTLKTQPKLDKLSSHIKIIGILEIFLAIIIGGYHALNQDAGIATAIIPGFLFLIGIVTAYFGSFMELYFTANKDKVLNND